MKSNTVLFKRILYIPKGSDLSLYFPDYDGGDEWLIVLTTRLQVLTDGWKQECIPNKLKLIVVGNSKFHLI